MLNRIINIFVAFMLCSCSVKAQGAKLDLLVRYGPVETVSSLSFIALFDDSNSRAAFLSPVWGVHIVEIVCDGIPLKGVDGGSIYEDFRYLITPKAKQYVYSVPIRSGLVVAESLGPSPADYRLIKYPITGSFNCLKIRYRIRYPDGLESIEMKAEYSRLSLDEARAQRSATSNLRSHATD